MEDLNSNLSKIKISENKLELNSRVQWLWLILTLLGFAFFYYGIKKVHPGVKGSYSFYALPVLCIFVSVYMLFKGWRSISFEKNKMLVSRKGLFKVQLGSNGIEDMRILYFNYRSFSRNGTDTHHYGFKIQYKIKSGVYPKKKKHPVWETGFVYKGNYWWPEHEALFDEITYLLKSCGFSGKSEPGE